MVTVPPWTTGVAVAGGTVGEGIAVASGAAVEVGAAVAAVVGAGVLLQAVRVTRARASRAVETRERLNLTAQSHSYDGSDNVNHPTDDVECGL